MFHWQLLVPCWVVHLQFLSPDGDTHFLLLLLVVAMAIPTAAAPAAPASRMPVVFPGRLPLPAGAAPPAFFYFFRLLAFWHGRALLPVADGDVSLLRCHGYGIVVLRNFKFRLLLGSRRDRDLICFRCHPVAITTSPWLSSTALLSSFTDEFGITRIEDPPDVILATESASVSTESPEKPWFQEFRCG